MIEFDPRRKKSERKSQIFRKINFENKSIYNGALMGRKWGFEKKGLK